MFHKRFCNHATDAVPLRNPLLPTAREESSMALRAQSVNCDRVLLTAALGMLCCLPGCSGESFERGAVSGTVRFNGEPVEDGKIVFYPAGDTQGPPAIGLIIDGQYSLEVDDGPIVGRHRVEIQGLRQSDQQVPDMSGAARTKLNPELVDRVLPFIPPEFNVRSTLKRDVTAGEQELNFDLEAEELVLPESG